MTQNTAPAESSTPCPAGSDLPTTPDMLLSRLDELGIAYTLYHHEAVFTVAQSEAVDAKIPGTHCRNFFLRDKKKRNFLVSLQNATQVDMKKLAPLIGGNNLSFGSSERLWGYLGVRPGSVCPYCITNDKNNEVTMILDASMMNDAVLNFHPLINTMTISVRPADIVRFIESTGHTPHIIDLSAAAPDKE